MLDKPLPRHWEKQYRDRFGPPSPKHPVDPRWKSFIIARTNEVRPPSQRRDKGFCECPGGEQWGGAEGSDKSCQNEIDHIHHIVYPHQSGKEKGWMMLGLCRNCHATIHGKNSVLDTMPCCKYHLSTPKRYVYPFIG